MVLAVPRRVRTGTPRRGIIYGFKVIHPVRPHTIVWGYVGQTRQRVSEREAQHRDVQPWADTIAGEWSTDPVTGVRYQAVVLDAGDWDDVEIDDWEQVWIDRLQPLYNILGNRRNPHRVKPWVAKRQRHTRDRAAGHPLWQPPHPVNVTRRRPLRPAREVQAVPRPVAFRLNWGWVVPVQVWIVGTAGLGWLTGEWLASVAATGVVAAGLGGYRALRRRRR
jgi:hypothetical protein